MADSKITALAALTAADPVNDMFPVVDVSDTSMAASGTTKRISANNILSSSPTASGALTVTGLVTAGSATITGALTVDTTTLVVDSANDRVGIGTATPVAKLIVRDGSNRNLLVASDASHLGSAGIAIGSFTDNAADWAPLSLVAKTSIAFGLNGTTAMTLNSTANLVLKGGTTGANGVGVTFPATQVASSDANCLDDYEEGDWTGTLKGSTTDPTVAVTATGRYTKVGRQVNVQIAFEGVSNIGASGRISITGLPFTNAALRTIGTAGAFTGATFTGTLISVLNSANSFIELIGVISNSSWNEATHNVSVTTYFWANVTYTV